MTKKLLSLFIVLILSFIGYVKVNAKEYNVLTSSSKRLFEYDIDLSSGSNYYYPATWTTREQNKYEYNKSLIYEDHFKRYRPLFYWNYHRIQAFEDGYKDTYVTSKISGFLVNSGASTFTVHGSTEISQIKSHNFEFAPEVKNIKLGGYSFTSSTTVTSILGASWTVSIGPNSPSGYYGFYTISNRTKYSIYHMYSESSKKYDLVYNVYENIYMFDSNKPDIVFIYTGNKSLV